MLKLWVSAKQRAMKQCVHTPLPIVVYRRDGDDAKLVGVVLAMCALPSA